MRKENLPRSTNSFGSAALRATKEDEVNRKMSATHDRARASFINFYELWKATEPAIRQPPLPLPTPPSSDIYQMPPEQPPTTTRFNGGHRMDRRQSGLPRNRKWRATIRAPPLPLSTPSTTPRRMDRRQRKSSQDRKGKAPIWEPPLPLDLSTPLTTSPFNVGQGIYHPQSTQARPRKALLIGINYHQQPIIRSSECTFFRGTVGPTSGQAHDSVPTQEEFPANEPRTATTREAGSQDVHRAASKSSGETSPPPPATTASEGAPPAHQSSTDTPNFAGSGSPNHSPPPWSRSHEGDQWRPPEPAHEDHPPSTSPSGQDEGFTGQEFPFDFMDLDADESDPSTTWSQRRSGLYPKPAARPGHGSQPSAGMFTNAQVKVFGGTFVNVAHNYGVESSVLTSGSAFPIAMLGLQAVSFATRSNYPHFGYQLDRPVTASPPSVNVVLQFPSVSHEIKIMVTLWLFFKMWVRQRAREHH